jgi:murein DD-endopeptidase MepM/ murein hydrolase activator NlpD
MRQPPRSRFKLAASSAIAGFVAGAATMAILVVIGERRARPPSADLTAQTATEASASAARPTPPPASPLVSIEPTQKAAEPPAVLPPPAPSPEAPPVLHGDPTTDLRQRRLELPVQGATRDKLHDSFDEKRGGTRRHEAIDILAPLNTPVLAVEDGKIAKLFRSDAGGITVYQFDPTSTYVYYYAHLDHYAAGLTEGKRVARGQVIGYVGVTGNAPKDTPHLHFAIFRLTPEKKWWQGTPIDPYDVLK